MKYGEKIGPPLGIDPHPVTRARVFPGGAIADFPSYLAQVRTTWPFLGDERSARMAAAYGASLAEMLDGATDEAGMGADLGGGLTEIEVRWMRDREFARSAEDALERRSKLGVAMTGEERARVEKWWGENPPLQGEVARSAGGVSPYR